MEILSWSKAKDRLADDLLISQGGVALIGAGVSKTAGIPTATEIVQDLKVRFPEKFCDIDALDAGAYGKAMAQLTLGQRRSIIKPMLQGDLINWGHVALAQLMAKGFVKIVLTVNFDSLLQRGCGLIGLYPAIYDFGSAPASRVQSMDFPAVVHLHGQGHGFVTLNTKEETQAHQSRLEPLLQFAVNRWPLFVIGYSGTSDGVFDGLKKVYDGSHPLYWLSHGDSEPMRIPNFLNKHSSAVLGRKVLADNFLVHLATKLEAWPPEPFFGNISGHLRAQLNSLTDYPVGKSSKHSFLASYERILSRLTEVEEQETRRQQIQRDFLSGHYANAMLIVKELFAKGRLDDDLLQIGYDSAVEFIRMKLDDATRRRTDLSDYPDHIQQASEFIELSTSRNMDTIELRQLTAELCLEYGKRVPAEIGRDYIKRSASMFGDIELTKPGAACIELARSLALLSYSQEEIELVFRRATVAGIDFDVNDLCISEDWRSVRDAEWFQRYCNP